MYLYMPSVMSCNLILEGKSPKERVVEGQWKEKYWGSIEKRKKKKTEFNN